MESEKKLARAYRVLDVTVSQLLLHEKYVSGLVVKHGRARYSSEESFLVVQGVRL